MTPWWQGRSARFWLLVLSPLVVIGGCGLFSIYAHKTAVKARREAAIFHQRIEAGDYAAIYQAASPNFQLTLKRDESANYFRAIHEKMGACAASGEPTTFTKATASGTFVQLRYKLQCANGKLQETMLYMVMADGLRLEGYDASSPTLVIR